MSRLLIALVASTLVCLAAATGAEAKYRTFVSPSRTTICRIVVPSGKEKPNVRCDVYGATNARPEKPKSCEFDWGFSFGMSARGRAGRNCVSDAIADPAKAKVLRYGRSASLGGITCRSRRTGMTCRNRSGHGFTLRRESQKIF